jgi:4-amino-4-deoxy-L-arabinose transferase-like glycosyltransferase
VAPFFGLGVDEAHYVLYAKYLDLSYVDHPPLVGWVHVPFFYLLGTNEFLARLPAILIFAVTSYCAYLFVLKVTRSIQLSLWAVLALNCSFMLNALGLMLLPDSLLLLFVFLLIFTAEKITRENKPLDFILLGILLGLMGLTKYTSILLVPPLIIFFVLKKRYDIIFSRYMFLAAFIALILITPVIYWNVTHDFISFRYQGSHVFGSLATSFSRFFESLAAQFGAYNPLLFIIAFYGFFQVLRTRDNYLRLAVLFGGTILLFFLLTSFYERTLPHWPAVFYLLFIPVGTYNLVTAREKWKKYFLNFSIGLSFILTLFVYAELAGKYFTFPDYKSPFRDIYGFPEITKQADELIKNNLSAAPKAIAVTNWTMGSRMMYYSLSYKTEVFVIDNRKDQFDVWQKKSPIGYDLLFLNTYFQNLNIEKDAYCERVEAVAQIDLILRKAKVDTVEFVWCRNYGGAKP